jgi:branched-chain amino acid transport system permease protein
MEHYLIAMAVTAGIYAIMALGMNVIWGMAGLINLGLVGFFAVGAYTSALLTLKFGWPIAGGVIAAMIVSSLVGVIVALVTVNLKGDYLAIVTLGFAETMRIVMSNEIWLANGTDGLSGIPGPMRQQLGPHGFNLLFLGIVAVATLILFVLNERLAHSPFGRALRGIRDDEQVVQVAGKNVTRLKVKAFAFGSAALGLAGALYGHFTSYIAPDLFEPLLTLYVILALLAGGLGNNKGAVLGAVAVVFFLESTRFIMPLLPFVSAVQGAALRQMLIAAALLVILRFYTQGLIPEKIQQPALPDALQAKLQANKAEIDDVKA